MLLAVVSTSAASLVLNPRCGFQRCCAVCHAEVSELRRIRLYSCAPEDQQEGNQEVPASSSPFVCPSEEAMTAGAGIPPVDIPPVDPRPEQPGGDPGPGTLILRWRDVKDHFDGRAYLTPSCNPDPYPYPYPLPTPNP